MVHVWSIPLRCAASAERRLLALLDSGEAARAARLGPGDERRRHVVSHGVLRLVLSAFTGLDPRAVPIVTAERGKPYLAVPGPHFSLSHASDMAAVAVSTDGPVGVDVERIRADVSLDIFARDLLPAPEVERIDALPSGERVRAWFQAWTRLEAVAKASGEGLRDEMAKNHAEPATFRTWDLQLEAPFVGAVAAALPMTRVAHEPLSGVA